MPECAILAGYLIGQFAVIKTAERPATRYPYLAALFLALRVCVYLKRRPIFILPRLPSGAGGKS
nr:MAG TPA: protein of unknown function DUF4519 [Caudoviricetes sp.]